MSTHTPERNESVVEVRGRRECADKVRREYHLPRRVTLDVLDRFQGAEIELQQFSSSVAGAADHFVMRWGEQVIITGAVGGQLLLATFQRLEPEMYPVPLVRAFERQLKTATGLSVTNLVTPHSQPAKS